MQRGGSDDVDDGCQLPGSFHPTAERSVFMDNQRIEGVGGGEGWGLG